MKAMKKIQTKLLIDENCNIRDKNYTEWDYKDQILKKGRLKD